MKYFILFFLFFICINCKGKLIDKISDCIISELGQFKYIQIKVMDKKDRNKNKIVIRGKLGINFHVTNFKAFLSEMEKDPEIFNNFDFEPIGGGWITIDKNNINICGFSTAYGKARHAITSAILSQYYPNHKITNDERLFIF